MSDRLLPIALTIAGSDPSGGAGIQADLKTFAAFDVFGASVITAITAQNTMGVSSVVALDADTVTAQIEAVASDYPLAATKIGMLANAAIAEAVAAAIDSLNLPLVVVDPVLMSTSGTRLLDDDGIDVLCRELLPRALVITPNIPEAEFLSGRTITSLEQTRAAAVEIHQHTGAKVVIKGGHGEGDEIVDLLFDGEHFCELSIVRADTPHTHGTGCSFASAIAAALAKGASLVDAVAQAQAYVSGAAAHSLALGHGRGPIDHFWRHRSAHGPA
jgi:hydroxymethylpyrimidine/phosphomethylpyrimidine kinase